MGVSPLVTADKHMLLILVIKDIEAAVGRQADSILVTIRVV